MNPSTRLLASVLPLPPSYSVFWKRFSPANDNVEVIELARRRILSTTLDSDFNSLLPRLCIDSSNSSSLYVFLISPATSYPRKLNDLAFAHLVEDASSRFRYSDLFQHCIACNSPRQDCHSCASAHQLPTPFTEVYHLFLAAVREKIIYTFCEIARNYDKARILPLRDGFMLCRQTQPTGEWAFGWEGGAQRPLTQCYLHLHMDSTSLLVQPYLRPSTWIHLDPFPNPGVPIVLLPHATPAYFISKYTGTTASLTEEFRQSLLGIAPTDWGPSEYIVCWIRIQNKQGTERGVSAVWPRHLVLASTTRSPFPVSSTLSRPLSPVLAELGHTGASEETLKYFRAITFASRQDLNHLATSTSTYVDAVAKERERERERVREQRNKRLDATSPTTSTVAPQPPAPTHPTSHNLSQYYPSPPEFTPSVQAPFITQTTTVSDNSWPDFNFNPLPNSSVEPAGSIDNVADLEMAGFDMFTEDDFDFFDQPGVQSTSNIILDNDSAHNGLTSHNSREYDDMIMTPSNMLESGWSSASIGDHISQFATSRVVEPPNSLELPTIPALLLPSADKTPCSPASPMTPGLEFEQEPAIHSLGGFEAIPFAGSHLAADGKYSIGKFALNTSEEASAPWAIGPGLKNRYDAATNPRVGIVKKLIEVKLKFMDSREASGGPEDWQRTHEEDLLSEAENGMIESESDSDQEPAYSHPHTQAREESVGPVTLPLGPGLLHSNFHHRHLLLLSIPFESSNLASGTIATPAPMSVPTPVSPAAAISGGSDRAKTLEGVAYAIAKEVMENSVWAEAWRMWTSQWSRKRPLTVPCVEIRQLMQLMERTKFLQPTFAEYLLLDARSQGAVTTPSLDKTPLSSDPPAFLLGPLEAPLLSIGQGGKHAVQMQPSALRFWEKLGLCPLGGQKPVTAFVLFEEDDPTRIGFVENWLQRIGTAYTMRGFGPHIPGAAGSFTKGLVPLRWDAFRKILALLSTAITRSTFHIVFYILIPTSFFTVGSAAFRQLISSIVKARKQSFPEEEPVLFQLVPEHFISEHTELPQTPRLGFEPFVLSIYDRLLRLTDRQYSRPFFPSSPTRSAFQVHAFNLSRKALPQVQYCSSWPPLTLDALNRHEMLHVGYRISESGEWLFVSTVDERGESYDTTLYANAAGAEISSMERIVSHVWTFAMKHACRSTMEWRIVIVRWGTMTIFELQAWCSQLQTVLVSQDRPLHVTILCAQHDPALALLSPDPPSPLPPAKLANVYPPGTFFADVSSLTYAIFPRHQASLAPLPIPIEDLILEEDDSKSWPAGIESPALIPLLSSMLIRIPCGSDYSMSLAPKLADKATSSLTVHLLYTTKTHNSRWQLGNEQLLQDITINYHDLTVLAQERWKLTRRLGLPLHLAALEEMDWALENAPLLT